MSSAITFTFFLITFIAVGLLSTYKQSNGSKHYLLANRAISPLFVALSAAASKYSGYMFIGLMGYIYTHGLSAIWIVLGFLVGDFIALYVAHHSLRAATTTTRALSFSGLISRWHYGDYQKLRLSIGMITLIFLSTFAAAQFNAGGKALHAVFGWNYQIGAILCAILILSYSVIGGLKASIWTDVMQAIIMLFALGILLIYSLQRVGGITPFLIQISAISPSYLDLGIERFGSIQATVLFALGWLFNGIGTLGQPHIMVRLMALHPTAKISRTACYYYTWSHCCPVNLKRNSLIP